MPTLATKASFQMEWNWTEPFGLLKVEDKAKQKRDIVISDASQQDMVWQDEGTLAANTYTVIDLDNLNHETLGVEGVVKLETIVQFFVEVTSSTGQLLIGPGELNGSTSFYAIKIEPKSFAYLCNLDTGWTGTGREMQFANPTSESCTYKIALIGNGDTVSA